MTEKKYPYFEIRSSVAFVDEQILIIHLNENYWVAIGTPYPHSKVDAYNLAAAIKTAGIEERPAQ